MGGLSGFTVDSRRADQSGFKYICMLRTGLEHDLVYIAMECMVRKCEELLYLLPVVVHFLAFVAVGTAVAVFECEDPCSACV